MLIFIRLCRWFSGEDAYRKIRAGATLVQLYTAFAYGGPALIPQIKVFSDAHITLLCSDVKDVLTVLFLLSLG